MGSGIDNLQIPYQREEVLMDHTSVRGQELRKDE